MTIDPKAVRALRRARERMRDLAASRYAAATLECERAAAQLTGETAARDQFFDTAPELLAAATSVDALAEVAAARSAHDVAIADATAGCSKADSAAQVANRQLRDSARELRIAEKLQERLARERQTSESRAEQRQADDLNSARRR